MGEMRINKKLLNYSATLNPLPNEPPEGEKMPVALDFSRDLWYNFI